MKKILLAFAAAVLSVSAFAHPARSVHYHTDDGVIYSRSFEPSVETTYERDAMGRRVRVDTTTSCTQVRINRNNNHLRCLDEDVTVKRTVEGVVSSPNRPMIEPVIYRSVERQDGRRVIITTTYTCADARWNPDRTQALCFRWDERVDREIVRRQPRDNNLDLNGDGQVDGWERLLFQSFREVLDNN